MYVVFALLLMIDRSICDSPSLLEKAHIIYHSLINKPRANMTSIDKLITRQALAKNLAAVLDVCGPTTQTTMPGRLPKATIQQKTGVARTTINAITNPQDGGSTPDLGTLCKIAEQLPVSAAWLLMTPADLLLFMKSYPDIGGAMEAVQQLGDQFKNLDDPNYVLRALKEMKVHPTYPPVGVTISPVQRAALDIKNESMRRTALSYSALFRTGAKDTKTKQFMIALAACMANHAEADKAKASLTKEEQ